MPGPKRIAGRGERILLTLPKTIHAEMMDILEAEDRWPYPARQNFIIEAVKEKIERWRREHPLGLPGKK